MTETNRTLVFVVLAAVSLVAARFGSPGAPKAPPAFSDVGKEFYPSFTDADAAKQLQIIAYNADIAEARLFGVEFKDGQWRIPSRHNYPVDGKDRLAKCAASIIGLKREALAGQRETEFPEFEVVDPLDDKSDSLKRGQRLTLKDGSGKVLADYIIGKQAPGRSGNYYVRRPDEKATYIAKVELQLSTKFADWIEPDLLKVSGFDLRHISVNNDSVDAEGRMVRGDQNVLDRKTGSDPWKLTGMDEAAEEVNQDEVRKLVSAIDELKIVGVRPKPVKLQRDLRLDKGLKIDQGIMMDLGMKGFLFSRTPDGDLRLVSKEGELVARTEQGVEYMLRFGDVFTGNEEEIEFGFAKSDDSSKSDGEKHDGDQPTDAKKKKAGETKKSRYLFVTASFNADALDAKPESPTKPEDPGPAPDGAEPPARAADSPADAMYLENVGPFAEYRDKKRIYDALLAKYEADERKFAADTSAYEAKVKEGEKKVKELNYRFADWYYVIAGDIFEDLRQGRKNLVKPKSADKPADSAGPAFPGAPN